MGKVDTLQVATFRTSDGARTNVELPSGVWIYSAQIRARSAASTAFVVWALGPTRLELSLDLGDYPVGTIYRADFPRGIKLPESSYLGWGGVGFGRQDWAELSLSYGACQRVSYDG